MARIVEEMMCGSSGSGDRSNLHQVWDSEMINSKQLSFELADFIDDGLDVIEEWQSTHLVQLSYLESDPC